MSNRRPPHSIQSLAFQDVTLLGHEGEPVFEGMSADLPVNAVVWVRASSGGGKSKFLRLLAGLEEPDEGAYLINGTNVTKMNFSEFSPWQRRIGFGFESGGLLSNKTISQNLMLPFFYHRNLAPAEAQERVDTYLAHFGLDRFKDRRPAACSSGNRKLASLALALITWPELLILDSPTSGLDEGAIRKFLDLLEVHRSERGLRHLYLVSEDERFMETFTGHWKLDLADLQSKKAAA